MRRLESPLRLGTVLLLHGLLFAVTGCAEGGEPADGEKAIADGPIAVEVPTGEGSGQPYLSSSEGSAWLSWLEPTAGEGWALRLVALDEGVGPTRTIAERDDFFVNWADFPSVEALPDGRLVAHWLQRGGTGGVDYGVRVVWSGDGGQAWSTPWTPHDDESPTEHGFVTILPDDEAVGVVWLDGRRFVDGPAGPATGEMTLRYRTAAGPDGVGPEVVVDDRTCDCCPTAAARTADGWVVVYRDRSADEIRDIHLARLVDGVWSAGRPVHRDGWRIEACPVDGPTVVADGRRVAVAWFTAAGERPRVLVAFSDDQGVTFDEPIRIDDGDPVGRVDLVLEGDGVRVSWIENSGGSNADLRHRGVSRDGSIDSSHTVAALVGSRATGFPRMIRHSAELIFAWTDAQGDDTRVRVARWPGFGDPS